MAFMKLSIVNILETTTAVLLANAIMIIMHALVLVAL
jgi:hypothetical protein